MEFGHDNLRRRVVEEEDRLSSLPDDVIHKILSCFDIKFAVQTCVLSSRWQFLWTSMHCLNFSTESFRLLSKFPKFVNHVLTKRNHQIRVSSMNLHFRGTTKGAFVKKIAKYAFSHDVQQLTVCPIYARDFVWPPFLSTSQSLKHFKLICNITKTPLDFPALTSLNLTCITLCDDLFSKCVNLKTLTLQCFVAKTVFNIVTPRLSNLILHHGCCLTTINVIAPQLENLTMVYCSFRNLNVSPQLSSFCYTSSLSSSALMNFSNDPFLSLNKVSIRLFFYCEFGSGKTYEEEDACRIICMLQKLRSARYLTLNTETVECISAFPDLLLQHSSPFSNLICLTIDCSTKTDEDVGYKVKMSTKAKNFLLDNSTTATLIMK